MLRVTIEMVPYGIEERKRPIGVMTIALQRVTGDNVGHYVSRIETDQRGPQPPKEVVALTHERAKGAAELVRRCLNAHLRKLSDSA